MSIYEILLLSAGLAMDATAVLFCLSLTLPKAKRRLLIKAAVYFAFFQGGLPIIGYLAGQGFDRYIESIDHWIAFVLLWLVGGKMILEANETVKEDGLFSTKNLIVLGIATSIDALVVGVTFSFVKVNVPVAVLIIALVTFALALAAGLMARRLTHFKPSYLRVAGGLAIVFIGIKILIDHQF